MQLKPDEIARLFALDESLRAEADHMLAESGLGAIIEEVGYVAVGSYALKTMTWRDLDFIRVDESADRSRHWEIGAHVAATGWVWRLMCLDAYHDPRVPGRHGLYWDVRARNPQGGSTWKLDLWTARAAEHAPRGVKAEERSRLLTEEARLHILAIKDAYCRTADYHDTVVSGHIYEAVLEHGVRGIGAFREWWRLRYGDQEGRRARAVRVLDPPEWTGTL